LIRLINKTASWSNGRNEAYREKNQAVSICICKVGSAAEGRSKTYGNAIVIGDSIARGIDRCFCGCKPDSRLVCCLSGARVKDVSERLQDILKGEG